MEDSIRSLCQQLVTEQDDRKVEALAARLRVELHAYIEQTRANLSLLGRMDETIAEEARRKKRQVKRSGLDLPKPIPQALPKPPSGGG